MSRRHKWEQHDEDACGRAPKADQVSRCLAGPLWPYILAKPISWPHGLPPRLRRPHGVLPRLRRLHGV